MTAVRRTFVSVIAIAALAGAPAYAATSGDGGKPSGARGCPASVPATVSRHGAGAVQLLLSSQQQTPFLRTRDAPLPSGSFTVLPMQPLTFTTNVAHRPLSITGASCLRLHLDHWRSAPAHLSVTLTDADADTGRSATLAAAALTVPAGVRPAHSLDLWLPTPRGHRIAAGHTLELTLALAPTDVDMVHVYYGGLPGECDSGDTAQEVRCGNGGANPARVNLPVRDTYGAFSAW